MSSQVDALVARWASTSSVEPDRLLDWQLARLRALLEYVSHRSGFYRHHLAGINASDITSWSAFETLPFTTPMDVADDPSRFLCVAAGDVCRVTTIPTSGTTGPSKRVFFTEEDLARTVDFFEYGMREMMAPQGRLLVLLSGETPYSIGALLRTAVARFGVTTTTRGSTWTLEQAIRAAEVSDCIVGMPADLLYVCRVRPGLRPRSVLLSADYVPRSVVSALETTWKCEVFSHFGMTETGFGCAVQCASRETHHIRHDYLLLEVIEPTTGRRCPAGSPGEIVVTTFGARAMPLLRYRTGDIGIMSPGSCRCGGALPRLDRVSGRRGNEAVLRDGGTLTIHRLDDIFFASPAVRAYRARLVCRGEERDRLEITIDSSGPIGLQAVVTSLPVGVRLDLRYAELPPFHATGKRRLDVVTEGCHGVPS